MQDASEFPVYALSAHLAPREAGISCPLARTKNREGVEKQLLLCFLIRVRGYTEPLQDASDFLVSTLLVHLAPRGAGISCPLARTVQSLS